MEKTCDCCGQPKPTLIIYPASNPEEDVTVCDECRSEVFWHLMVISSPNEIRARFDTALLWGRLQKQGMSLISGSPQETVPEPDATEVRVVELERLVTALSSTSLHDMGVQSELRNRISALEQQVGDLRADRDRWLDIGEALHFCFGGYEPEKVVSFTQEEMQSLQRVSRAQLEMEAKRAR
jgi:hypothetical protein